MTAFPRNRPIEVPTLGLRASLEAPGLVPIPSASNLPNTLAGINSILSALGAGASEAIHLRRQQRLEEIRLDRERAAIVQKEINKVAGEKRIEAYVLGRPDLTLDKPELIKASQEGFAARNAENFLADFNNALDDGRIQFNPASDLNGQIQTIISQQVQGHEKEYTQFFASLVAKPLADQLARRIALFRERARDQALDAIGDRIIMEERPFEIQQLIKVAHESRGSLTEKELLAKVMNPALTVAATDGNVERVKMLNGVLGGSLIELQKIQLNQAQNVKTAQEARRDAQYFSEVRASLSRGIPPEELEERLSRDMAGIPVLSENAAAAVSDLLGKAKENRLTRLQDQNAKALFDAVLSGSIPLDQYRQELIQRQLLDTSDPRHIDRQLAQADENRAMSHFRDQEVRNKVLSVLQGAGGISLTESEHGDQVLEAMKIHGAFTGEGRIADPGTLLDSLLKIDLLPSKLTQTVFNALNSPDDAQVNLAASVLANLDIQKRDQFERWIAKGTPQQQHALRIIRDEMESGSLSRLGESGVARTIRDALRAADPIEPVSLDPILVQELNTVAAGSQILGLPQAKLEDIVVQRILPEVVRNLTENLGDDWFWDPSFEAGSDVIRPMINNITTEYFKLRSAPYRYPQQKAFENAVSAARSRLLSDHTFIRWDDMIRVVPVRQGSFRDMPMGLRWRLDFEPEMKQDLLKLGIDPDTVSPPSPWLETIPEEMGYVVYDSTGSVITRTNPRTKEVEPLVWQPRSFAQGKGVVEKREPVEGPVSSSPSPNRFIPALTPSAFFIPRTPVEVERF